MPGSGPASLPLLVVLLGPTASGKTALAIELAERFRGEIVSCDSVAVYRGMNIGAAKPTPEERRLVPHHLIDVASPDEHYTAGDYSRDARSAIRKIAAQDRLPIVTGGTGLYLRAVLLGLFASPDSSPALRERLRRSHAHHDSLWLHRILSRIDPPLAGRIHPNDTPKLVRAIEVCLSARRPMSQAWQSGREPLSGFRILRIGLDPERKLLYARINLRAAAMFDEGLVEETRQLIKQYGGTPRVFDSLGYRQARAVLQNEMELPAAVDAARQGHRNYAKRQLTWFRREPEVCWLKGFGDDPSISARAAELVAQQTA